jgi:hypothetical protein
VIVLNTDGFYDGLKSQLNRMYTEGLLKVGEQATTGIKTLEHFVKFVNTADEVMSAIEAQ